MCVGVFLCTFLTSSYTLLKEGSSFYKESKDSLKCLEEVSLRRVIVLVLVGRSKLQACFTVVVT